jgi:hypothetical protein
MRSHFTILLFAGIVLSQGCAKSVTSNNNNNNNNNNNPPPAPREKRLMITRIYAGDESYSNPGIAYDSLGRIVSFSGVPGSYLVFYKNDTIHHILEPRTSFNSLFSRSSWIFQYRADKKCYRVLYKHIDSYDDAQFVDSNPFWSDESNASNYTQDSLVYNATGQLVEIWQPSLVVCKLVYDSANAVVPSRMNDYIDNDGDGIPEYVKYHTSLTYTDIDQPASTQLWFFPFLNFNVPVSPSNPATYSRYFIVLLKKAVRQYAFGDDAGYLYISPNFEYSYDSDSTHFSGQCNPADLSAWFGYEFTKE